MKSASGKAGCANLLPAVSKMVWGSIGCVNPAVSGFGNTFSALETGLFFEFWHTSAA